MYKLNAVFRSCANSIGLLSAMLFAAWAGVSAHANDKAEPFWEREIGNIPDVDPRLREEASLMGMPIGELEIDPSRDESREGDQVTLQAVMWDGDEANQWLIGIEWKADGEKRSEKVVRYASTGDVFEFSSETGQMAVNTLGPAGLSGRSGVASTRAMATVETEFLSLGFDRSAKLRLRLSRAREAKPELPYFWFYTNRTKPVDEGTVKVQRELMKTLKVEKGELRIEAGFGVALDSFVKLINDTSGVSEILWSVAKKPSFFSMLGGISTGAEYNGGIGKADPRAWGLPEDMEVYRYPIVFIVNGKQALYLSLFVTQPKAPLNQTAGIVGLIATPPKLGSDKSLVIRMVGAQLIDE